MPTVEDRSRYQSDFGVSWPRLPVLVAAALLTAVVVAWGLKFVYVHNWYLIMLVPLAGGGVLAGVLYLMVGWAHCRNCWLAAVIGVVAGTITYLGCYQFCLMDLLPPGAGWRVDLLPRFIGAADANRRSRGRCQAPDESTTQETRGLHELLLLRHGAFDGCGGGHGDRLDPVSSGLLRGVGPMDAAGNGPAGAPLRRELPRRPRQRHVAAIRRPDIPRRRPAVVQRPHPRIRRAGRRLGLRVPVLRFLRGLSPVPVVVPALALPASGAATGGTGMGRGAGAAAALSQNVPAAGDPARRIAPHPGTGHDRAESRAPGRRKRRDQSRPGTLSQAQSREKDMPCA